MHEASGVSSKADDPVGTGDFYILCTTKASGLSFVAEPPSTGDVYAYYLPKIHEVSKSL